jgi:hypothetical protein
MALNILRPGPGRTKTLAASSGRAATFAQKIRHRHAPLRCRYDSTFET